MTGRALLLGGTGILGHATAAALARRKRPFDAPPRTELDLADAPARIAATRPAIVFNLAGFTDVGAAERPEHHDEAQRLNAALPEALAHACARAEIPLVHVSTDYVFDGAKRDPYLETDPVAPLQVYGRTKLDGERAVLAAHPNALVIRVSTLYGPGRPQKPAYVDAILGQALPYEVTGGGVLEVVEAPVSSPTYAPDVAEALLDLADRNVTGLVHVVNDGAASRLELARATLAASYLADRVIVKTKPEPAGSLRRPAYSVLDTARLRSLLGRALPPWRDALSRYIELLRVGS